MPGWRLGRRAGRRDQACRARLRVVGTRCADPAARRSDGGLALIEAVVHWFIDLGKCEKLYNIHVDQGLHMICKVIWWLAVTRWFVA